MITNTLSTLRLNRLMKGLSQYKLAQLSGVAQVRISYAERGYECLKDYQKEALAKVLESSVNNLFPEGEPRGPADTWPGKIKTRLKVIPKEGR